MLELLNIHSKALQTFSSSSSRSVYKWLSIPNSSLFMLNGCTHMFHLCRCNLHLHKIVGKTSRWQFSIDVEFFACALFKENYKCITGFSQAWEGSPWPVCTPPDSGDWLDLTWHCRSVGRHSHVSSNLSTKPHICNSTSYAVTDSRIISNAQILTPMTHQSQNWRIYFTA